MSRWGGVPLKRAWTSSSWKQRVAKAVRRCLERTRSGLRQTATFKSMSTENQWGESCGPLRMDEVKTNWPQNCMLPLTLSQIFTQLPITLCACWNCLPGEDEEKGLQQSYSWGKNSRKSWNKQKIRMLLHESRGPCPSWRCFYWCISIVLGFVRASSYVYNLLWAYSPMPIHHFFLSIFMRTFSYLESPVIVCYSHQMQVQFKAVLLQ